MATNEEFKQALRDAIATDHSSDEAVDAAAEAVIALVPDSSTEPPVDPVATAVVEAIKTAGIAKTFGNDALVAELEAAGFTVTAPEVTTPVEETPPVTE